MVAGTSFLRAIAKEAAPVKALEIINLCQPSQVREFPYGQLELFHIAGQVIGRATYQPGWRWTQHVGPTAGTKLCEVEHLGLVVSGRAAVRMADGTERVLEPGDLFAIPPGHDSWVVDAAKGARASLPNPLGPAPGQPVEVERRDQTGSPGRTRDQNSHYL